MNVRCRRKGSQAGRHRAYGRTATVLVDLTESDNGKNVSESMHLLFAIQTVKFVLGAFLVE